MTDRLREIEKEAAVRRDAGEMDIAGYPSPYHKWKEAEAALDEVIAMVKELSTLGAECLTQDSLVWCGVHNAEWPRGQSRCLKSDVLQERDQARADVLALRDAYRHSLKTHWGLGPRSIATEQTLNDTEHYEQWR